MLKHNSVNLEASLEGNWKDASLATILELSRKVKEPQVLCFYPRAHFEITFTKDSKFAQGQMPLPNDVAQFCPIDIFVAPKGCKSVLPALVTRENFVSAGWREATIGTAPKQTQSFAYSIQAKCKQYSLRHHIASTIHAGMGQDLHTVVTKVTAKETDPNYSPVGERTSGSAAFSYA